MSRIICLILSVFLTTALFSQTAKKVTVTSKTATKPVAPKIFKNLRDSASYTAGIHIVNKYLYQNVYNFNSAILARAVDDLQSGKPQLISDDNADSIILNYKKKLMTNTKFTSVNATPGSVLNNLRDSASYVAGIHLVHSLRDFDLVDLNHTIITRAIEDLQNKKPPLIKDSLANMVAVRYQYKLQEIKNKPTIEAGKKFLAENKKRPSVKVTKSGLQYEVITMGTGKRPTKKDKVSCNYTGSFIDGTEFNNSYKMGGPISFDVTGVIKGWTEALQMMPVGSKWKLYLPYQLGYGPGGDRAIPGGAALIFEIDLLGIVEK